MMYWLTAAGRAPTGQLSGEDCIAFDRAHLAVVEIGGRWKVVEGTHWLLDFGPGQGNAIAALHFIRKYAFDQICFVGRPDPSMTYFKAAGRGRMVVELVDPRRIEAAIDHPRWWSEQVVAVAGTVPWIDLGAECLGIGPNPRRFGGFGFEVRGMETTEIVERHGITGLAVGKATEIRLASPAQVVDVGVAHFGAPPVVSAYAGDKAVAKVTLDARQRQIENARFVGMAIDRVTIASSDGEAVLNYVRSQPTGPQTGTTRKGRAR